MKRFHACCPSHAIPAVLPTGFPFACSRLWRIFRTALQDSRFAFHSSRIVTCSSSEMTSLPHGCIFQQYNIAHFEKTVTCPSSVVCIIFHYIFSSFIIHSDFLVKNMGRLFCNRQFACNYSAEEHFIRRHLGCAMRCITIAPSKFIEGLHVRTTIH